ncbi:hypothetical protein WA026_023631 [Henosepilachna vigintioctopunctata]|uniref:Uncharacterized protein n=1 Tax=Henosepilachna vigintioctopunctata TaxID=420089 RepID=A0AAW1UR32_9CUCU
MVTWNEFEVLQNLDVTKPNTSETPTTPPMEDKKERSPTPIDIREKPKWIDISSTSRKRQRLRSLLFIKADCTPDSSPRTEKPSVSRAEPQVKPTPPSKPSTSGLNSQVYADPIVVALNHDLFAVVTPNKKMPAAKTEMKTLTKQQTLHCIPATNNQYDHRRRREKAYIGNSGSSCRTYANMNEFFLHNEIMKKKQEFNTKNEPQKETSRRGELRNSQEDSENQEYVLNSRTKHE